MESYYITNKRADLEYMYEVLCELIEDGTFEEEETEAETTALLQGIIEKTNISFMIQDIYGQVYAATNNDKDWLQYQLITYILGKNDTITSVLAITDEYQISKVLDARTNMEYIEMWGFFENGESFVIRTPLESIRDSVAIANGFLLRVGVLLAILSALLIGYFSKRITKPILELAQISTRMADLDFDVKYTTGGNNEIGILGASFNAMSYRLERTISELKTANNELQQDIEKKEKMETMREEFLANVSHELKTPIALIQGYAEGLKEGVSSDRESQEFYCDVIMDEADKMNKLVKGLLELNNLEFGAEDVQVDRFDVVEMIHGILQSLDIIVQQKGCKVILDVQETANVWGEQFKVEHVIRNYLTNALNYVEGDNVIQIKVVCKEKARISVFNTGKQIPEEDIDRIWEKFYKVDKARTREYGGNGIGLSLVKAIMESLHQDYGVKNYDNGVEFWFELDIK